MAQASIKFPDHWTQEQIDIWIEINTYSFGPIIQKHNCNDSRTRLIKKLYQEMGELSESVLKFNQADILDDIGDCLITLSNIAHLSGFTVEECINARKL